MMKRFTFIGAQLAALTLGASATAQENPQPQSEPPPIHTVGPTVFDPLKNVASTEAIVAVVEDCISSISSDFRIDEEVLKRRGWSDGADFEFTLGGNSRIPATLHLRNGMSLVVETLPRGQICNAMSRIESSRQFDEIFDAVQAKLSTELFDEHKGHKRYKDYISSSASSSEKSHHQFSKESIIIFQSFQREERMIVAIKVLPENE